MPRDAYKVNYNIMPQHHFTLLTQATTILSLQILNLPMLQLHFHLTIMLHYPFAYAQHLPVHGNFYSYQHHFLMHLPFSTHHPVIQLYTRYANASSLD
jgi:hypothetical protein